MTIIKAFDQGSAVRVRQLDHVARPVLVELDAVDEERLELLAQVEALTVQLGERDQRIDALQAEADKALQDGRAEGYDLGLSERDERSVRALERLEEGLDQALEQSRDALISLQDLAVYLAREAMAKVFGETSRFGEAVTEILEHQLAKLEGEAVQGVTVSAEDFADAEALARLSGGLSRPSISVIASPDLKPGGCQIALRLGVLDVGMSQQWSRLSAIFDEALAAEPAR